MADVNVVYLVSVLLVMVALAIVVVAVIVVILWGIFRVGKMVCRRIRASRSTKP